MTSARRVEAVDPEQSSFMLVDPATIGVDKTKGDDGELFIRLKRMAKEAIEHYQPWWAEANESYDLYANRQWSEEDKKSLERQLRPAITFNRIGPVIDSLVGLEINNREMTKVYPRKVGNAKQSELWSAGLEWARDKANAEAEESDAFFDLAATGLGCVDTYLKPADREPGKYDVGMDRTDVTEVAVDPDSKKRNCTDARYMIRLRQIPTDSAEDLFPDCEQNELHAGWALMLDDGADPSRLPENYLFNSPQNYNQGARKTVTIVEVQWWEYEPYFMVEDPFTKQAVHMDKTTFDSAQRRYGLVNPGAKLNAAKYRRRVYKRAFLGTRILKQPPLPCPYHFSYQFITGKRDKTKRHWVGLIRAMKDPQMWANKWLSQILHILNSNAKGGIIADKNVFEDWKRVQKNWTNPAFIAWLAPGKNPAEVGYREQAQFPLGLMQLMQFGLQSVPDANGFSSELLGIADRDQPSSLEYQRRQAGMTVLAIFFHSLRQYRKTQGEIVLYMLQKWMADGRLVRVAIDTGDEQYIPLLLQPDDGIVEYDLVVDDAPSSPNQKEAVWSMLVQAAPMLSTMNMPQAVWGELLAYSPLPASVIQKMRESANDPAQQQQQQAMQQMTLSLMGAQAKLFEADAAKSKAGAVQAAASATASEAKAAVDQSKADAQEMENVLMRVTSGTAGLAVLPGPHPPMTPRLAGAPMQALPAPAPQAPEAGPPQ